VTKKAWSTKALLLAGVLGLPAVLDESILPLFVLATLAAIVTIGVSLLMGQAGQVSLGHGAFYATGAYTAGVLATQGCPTLVALALAPVAAALVATVVGVPLLMLRGHHLAFATLATHIIFLSVIGEMAVAGGDVGLQGIPRLSVGPVAFDSVRGYAYLSAFGLLAVALVARNILASRPGRALRALSTSELAAASSGIPVGPYKLAVFALSAAFAGLAGGIYAFYMGYLAPGSFPVLLSVEYVVMATIGGLGSIAGGVLGSVVVELLVHTLSRFATMSGMPDTAPVILSYAVYALLLIAAVLLLPGGVVSIPGALRRRIAAAKAVRARATPS
jgi:branched-chain amino acid transport system permease protein